jgi:hypothetical protein
LSVHPAGNLFSDLAVFDLVELMQLLPAAADISHLDLSHNQLLTWQCCGALGQLLSVALALKAANTAAAAQLGHSSAEYSSHRSTQHTHDASTQQGTEPAAAAAAAAAGADAGDASGARRPLGWHCVQPSFQRLVQPLQLQALLLQGVVILDKGAALLAEALASTQCLQVQHDPVNQ